MPENQPKAGGQPREYAVILVKTPGERDCAALCPELGCASQGENVDDALRMIAEAATIYLDELERAGQEPRRFDYDIEAEIRQHAADGSAVLRKSVQRIDWDALISECNTAIDAWPNDAEQLLKRANLQQMKGNDQQAIVEYNHVISLLPQSAEAYYGRGNSRFNVGSYNLAIADYDAAMRINPEHSQVINAMESAYYALWREQQNATQTEAES